MSIVQDEQTRAKRCITSYQGHYVNLFNTELTLPFYQTHDERYTLYQSCGVKIGVRHADDDTRYILGGSTCDLILIESLPPSTTSCNVYYMLDDDSSPFRPSLPPDETNVAIHEMMRIARNNAFITKMKRSCICVRCTWHNV